ncbi:hypothetical protein BD309DRAFT_40547 [Dichomitus squalens]|nr:hypothetical protein BD309DRAFT_40547 [Dichomitus squalens]
MPLDVSSPFPTPITVLARPSRMNGARDPAHSLPALPDDILVYITPYLGYSDLLRLSLASRHMHSMIPLHLAQFVCTTPEDLMKLGAYLYSDIDSRAPCLHSFALHLDQYLHLFEKLGRDLGDGIVNILAVTQQLRNLRLVLDAKWFHHHPRLLEAIGSLPCLTYMYLSRPLWSDIANPSIYSSCLRELHLGDRHSGWFSVADLSQALSRVAAYA